jgi:phosphoglycolate phosphatase-like HAD superfamily hydrolase
MPTVVLWDIDGTLVRSKGGRVSLTAFLRALRQVCNLSDADLAYPTDAGGKTDTQIALELLASTSIAEEIALEMLTGFGEAYLAELQVHRDDLTTDLRVLPGVREVMSRLHDLGICQSLLTGNLEPIARVKLACVGLDRYVDFELGAYGSDNPDRTCLVPVSRQRLRQRFGREVNAADIVVVGDTPRDIACARAGGTRVVAVATGNFSRAQLEAHQPGVVLDDLHDTDVAVAAVLGLPAAVH